MATLYVSDLDSTLLNSKAQLSPFSRDTLNTLIDKGLMFSYATARSAETATKVTKGLRGNVPIIVYTGTFITEIGTRHRLLSNFMDKSEIEVVSSASRRFSLYPIVYAFVDGKERFMYSPCEASQNVCLFADTREGDHRKTPVTGNFESTLRGDIFYFTFMEPYTELLPVYEYLRDKCNCLFQPDNYTDNWFLEVMPKGASKATAALRLKEMLGADKLVAFGDGYNDMELFKVADECYAVANAEQELKEIATAVIDSCDEDAVVKWLSENADI